MISCDNCSQSGIEIIDVEFNVPTVFGHFEIEMSVCPTCKSAIDYCHLQYLELNDELTKKLSSRAKQLRNSLKRELK